MVVLVKDCVVCGPTVLTVVPAPNCPPDREHVVLLVDDQLRVDVAPLVMVAGDAERDTLVLVEGVLVVESAGPPHETSPETTSSSAKKTAESALEPNVFLLFDMMVSLQRNLDPIKP